MSNPRTIIQKWELAWDAMQSMRLRKAARLGYAKQSKAIQSKELKDAD